MIIFLTVIFLISCKSVKTNDEVGTNNTEVVKTNIGTATDSPENIRKKIKNAKNMLSMGERVRSPKNISINYYKVCRFFIKI